MTSNEDIYNEFRRVSKQTHTNEWPHLEDLWSIPVKSHHVGGDEYKIKVDNSHIRHLSFLIRAGIDAILTLLTDWTLPFKHPLHWLYLIFVYPMILYVLFIAEIVSFIVDALRLNIVKECIHKEWSKHTAPDFYFDAEFFQKEENRSIVDEGIGSLDKPYHGESDDPINTVHHFNLEIAQLLLFMSDIIYHRTPEKVLEAKRKIETIKHHPEERDELLHEIVGLLHESDEKINALIKKWRLKFISVSELNTLGESYAGIFYSERHDFIVVAFKGPTVEKFESFVKDLLFQHVDGRPIVGFEAYNGYHSLLHPETEKPGPYTAIIEAIRNVTRIIRENDQKKKHINIWVTGHSMGGALATLFYGRCLKSPSDLGEHCILRDAYTFGSPCVGDSDLASTYASSLSKRGDLVNTLWRVEDDKDIMTRLPFGFYHPGGVGRYNILDNVHVGEGVRFYQDGRKPKLIRSPLISGHNQSSVINSSRPKEKNAQIQIPIHSLDDKLPSYVRDHLAGRYLMALTLARNHLNEETAEGSAKTKGYHGEITLEYEN